MSPRWRRSPDSVGLKVARLVRSYYGWKQARGDSDYGDQITEQDFSVFSEAIFHQNDSPLWRWLEWDDTAKVFNRPSRLGKLLGLLKDKVNGTAGSRASIR